MKAKSDLFYVSVPDSIPRIPISTPPFSKAELETISRYDKNYPADERVEACLLTSPRTRFWRGIFDVPNSHARASSRS